MIVFSGIFERSYLVRQLCLAAVCQQQCVITEKPHLQTRCLVSTAGRMALIRLEKNILIIFCWRAQCMWSCAPKFPEASELFEIFFPRLQNSESFYKYLAFLIYNGYFSYVVVGLGVFCSFFVVVVAGGWTQEVMHAKHMLHWATVPAPMVELLKELFVLSSLLSTLALSFSNTVSQAFVHLIKKTNN